MQNYRIILGIGIIEILIGFITLFFNLVTLIIGANAKTANALFFVIIAGSMSSLIGLGLLKFNKTAYQALIYFSSVIILTKFLILIGIIQLNGALETTIPGWIKTWISIFYHGAVIYFLKRPDVKEVFHV